MTTVAYDPSLDEKANNISVLYSLLQKYLQGPAQQAIDELRPTNEAGRQVVTLRLNYKRLSWTSTLPCPVEVRGSGETSKKARQAAARGMLEVLQKLEVENRSAAPVVVSVSSSGGIQVDPRKLMEIINFLRHTEESARSHRLYLEQCFVQAPLTATSALSHTDPPL